MKIAILGSRGFPSTYGGYETLVRHLAREWSREGHAVTVYCRTRVDRRHTWTTEGVRCRWTPGHDTSRFSTLSFGATAHLHSLSQRYDAALVLNVANGYFLPLLRARGIPSVVNVDGVEWERGKWGRVARKVFLRGAKLCARHADVLIADSQAVGAIWAERFGAAAEFIPYGARVLTEVGRDRVEELGLYPGRYVLAVARLTPENNVERFLDALEQMPHRPQTVVAGSANGDSPLERRLGELDARGSVRWLGHVSDQALLRQLWANCAVYVHGHSVGGTNPALLQAMGAGAPTLALDTPFNREVVTNDGQLFDGDASVLAERITALLAQPELRRRFAEHGRAVIAARYDWSAVTAQYLDALQLAQERRAQRGFVSSRKIGREAWGD